MTRDIHPDARPFVAKTDFSRREFLGTALATSFALAVQPVCAETTISTDTQGIKAAEVKIPVSSDTPMPAYQAHPAGEGPFPVVLVVQEIFGVHEHIRDVVRRLAKAGYYAIAPELYHREGNVAELKDIQEIIKKVVSRVPDAQVMSDLDKTVAYAKTSGKANTDKVAITGFCWGGRITWLYAAHNSNVKAGVAWYGRLVEKANPPLQPKHPIDIVTELKAPVLGLYGGADEGIPQEGVEKFRKALKDANKASEIVVYPNMPHGFHADYRTSYRKEAAEDGWKRMLAWFDKNGVK